LQVSKTISGVENIRQSEITSPGGTNGSLESGWVNNHISSEMTKDC
jgi:hypothetical protein